MTERQTPYHLIEAIKLGALLAQEFSSGRGIKEKIPNLDRGAPGMRYRFDSGGHVRSLRANSPAGSPDLGVAGQCQARYRSDAGQCFATKAQGSDRLQILKALYFAGGVATERQRQIFGADATTVVAHLNPLATTLLHFNINHRRPGIEAVFQQLLDQ